MLLNGSTPDFAGALALYNGGRHASAQPGGAQLSMSQVATAARGDLAYYKAAAARLGSATFLDAYLGCAAEGGKGEAGDGGVGVGADGGMRGRSSQPRTGWQQGGPCVRRAASRQPLPPPKTHSAALRGDGAYAGTCCGVRAEVARAAARWLAVAYGWFQLDSGVCSSTGCNSQPVNFTTAGELLLRQLLPWLRRRRRALAAHRSGAPPGGGAARWLSVHGCRS